MTAERLHPTLPNGEVALGLHVETGQAYEAVVLHGYMPDDDTDSEVVTWGEPHSVAASHDFAFVVPSYRNPNRPEPQNPLQFQAVGAEHATFVSYGERARGHLALMVVVGIETIKTSAPTYLPFDNLHVYGDVLNNEHRETNLRFGRYLHELKVYETWLQPADFAETPGFALALTTMPMPEVQRLPNGSPTTHGHREAAREVIETLFPSVQLPPLTTVRSQ